MSDVDDSDVSQSELGARVAPVVTDELAPHPHPYYMHYLDEDDILYLQDFVDLGPRLRTELELREPPMPYVGDLEKEDVPVPPDVEPLPPVEQRTNTVVDLSQRKAQRRAHREALDARKHLLLRRDDRYRKLRAVNKSLRRAAIAIAQIQPLGVDYDDPNALGFNPDAVDDREYDLSEVVGAKSRLRLKFLRWGGRRPRPLVTRKDGRVVGVLGGRPRNRKFLESTVARATAACAEVVPHVRLSHAESAIGATPTVTGGLGLVHEGEPVRAAPGKSAILDALVFASLFANPAIQRVAGYATCVFKIFAHHLYTAYDKALATFEENYRGSVRPFYFSVFSAATFYLGNRPLRVLDDDLAYGWTALTALGEFDPAKGGHIILWDFNLVLEFPSGSTILIPRSLVRYSFVRIGAGETRYCLAQFTPAAVFHFADNGARSDLEFAREASAEEHAAREAKRAAQEDGKFVGDLLTQVDSLDDDYYFFPVPPVPGTGG